MQNDKTGRPISRGICLALLATALAWPALAQRVDSRESHFRAWAVDRVVTDAQGRKTPAHAAGKLGFVAMYSPDGSLCLVEYVAARHEDLNSLRQDTDIRVKVFEKPYTRRDVFQAAAQAAGFTQLNLDKFFVRVP